MTYYLNTEMPDRTYATGLRRSLGTYYSHFASDQEFHQALCEALVGTFQEPWRVLDVLLKTPDPSTLELTVQGGARKLELERSAKRIDPDGYGCWPLPDGVVDCRFLQNKLQDPTVMLVQNLDFTVVEWDSRYWVRFRQDPFLTGDLEIISSLGVENTIQEQLITLWMLAPTVSSKPLEEWWGAVFGLEITTPHHRQALLKLLEACSTGPSTLGLMIGYGAAVQHPVCEVDQEKVRLVGQDRRGQYVLTDRSFYRYPPEANLLVVAEDVLRLGQPISDAIRWYDVSRSQYPPLDGWAVSAEELGDGYQEGLVFPNQELDLLVTTQGGKTKVSVELGGRTEDQELFWSEAHTRGVAGGCTIANSLDTRPNPVGEPQAQDLPATLNPYRLLAQEAMLHHGIVGVLNASRNLDPAGLEFLKAWCRLMPSHQRLMLQTVWSPAGGVVPGPTTTGAQFGLAASFAGGYYGIGPYGSAGGEPSLDQY